MFYLTLNEIKKYNMCDEGPEIIRWFENRYLDDEQISFETLFCNFGKIHTVFCLRAVKGGPEFALNYAIKCIEKFRFIFKEVFPGNMLFLDCVYSAKKAISELYPNFNIMDAKIAGANMEAFCNLSRTGMDKETKMALDAGSSAAKLAYAAYALSQPHVSVDFSLGAIENIKVASSNEFFEEIFQKALLKDMLLEGNCEQTYIDSC